MAKLRNRKQNNKKPLLKKIKKKTKPLHKNFKRKLIAQKFLKAAPIPRHGCFNHEAQKKGFITCDNHDDEFYNLRERKPKNFFHSECTAGALLDKSDKVSNLSRKSLQEKYRQFRKKLGEGGFGKVFGGVRIDGLPIAIKKIPKKNVDETVAFNGTQVPDEFIFHLNASLFCKGIVRPLDFCEDRCNYILVMERPLSFVCLYDYVSSRAYIPEREIKHIFLQLLGLIEKLHKGKIIHRDIKTENILIHEDSKQVKLIDFGCAALDQDGDFVDLCGTEQQFPPEYFRDNRYSGRGLDLWCLAQVLYFLFEKRYPFHTKAGILECKLELTSSTPTKAKDLLKKMLHPKENLRPSLALVKIHPWLNASR